LRDRRERAAALAALNAKLEAAGTPVVEGAGYDSDRENLPVSSLNREGGEPATEEDKTPCTFSRPTTVTTPGGGRVEGTGFHYPVQRLRRIIAEQGSDEGGAEGRVENPDRKSTKRCNWSTVRCDLVKSLLAKKLPPRGWQHFTVHAITHRAETAGGYEGTVAAGTLASA
jgi:ParB family chromosome partitioning protein